MGNPENSPPARPTTVPGEARWDPKDPGFEWVVGGLDAEGRRHGPYRSWTRDGILHGESHYVHGKVHGTNINFHPDGTVASEAEWVMGLILDSVFYRSDAPTSEPFAQAAPSVWSVRYYTRDGKTNYTIRYFLRDGTECGPDGQALPDRPAAVSPDARWFPELERWVDGAIERGTNHQVGPWRWWSREGVLRHEELRDASGQPTMVAQYEPDGSLKKKTTRSAEGEQRDYYFGNGQLSTRYREDVQGRQIYKATWSRDGALDEECTRTFDEEATGSAGAVTSVIERGARGVLRFEARREGPGLACVLYHGDGKTLAATGMIVDDVLTGTWRIFDDRGELRREVDTTPLSIEQRPTAHGLAWELGHVLYASDEATLPTPPQLVGVDDEPWAETAGCFDEHVEVFPRMLRGLAASDPLIRQYCLGAIESEIEHQGSTYPATARAIPWLARLLSHRDVDRSRLLDVIRQAAENVAPYVAEVRDLDADDPDRVAIEGTHEAICVAWPDIFACFATATAEERQLVLSLAKLAPTAKTDILEVARHDADASTRACAVECLAAMPGCELADLMPCLADNDPLVRAATAIALALAHGPATPREVVGTLREIVHGYREIAERFAGLPHADGHILAYLALAAGAVRTPDARSLARALCERIDDVDGRSALTYGRGLLALAFGRGDKPFAKRFVEILDALATSKQFWVFDADARELLATWHLPRGRDDLVQLVGQLKANLEPETWLHAKMHRG